MISVEEALAGVLALVAPLGTEEVALRTAAGRVLAEPARAHRDQPPFASSAMDGYAVQDADIVSGARLSVIGESAAGQRFSGSIASGQAVRIFTGAPVPEGANRILIQEDCTRDGNVITVGENIDAAHYLRPAGGDFKAGETLGAPLRLGPSEIALLAAMNVPQVTVRRKPQIALIATGDELRMPGETPGPDQIISSNNFGLAAMVEANGGVARILPIAADTPDALRHTFSLAGGSDLIVTLGGASVGDRDLVRQVADEEGLDQSFYKVAMRPGKPLMAGRLGKTPMLGLPGNPVSSMVCGLIFLLPALRVMLGLPPQAGAFRTAPLGVDIGPNGMREHYLRATLHPDGTITPFERQDSSLLSVLTQANCLMVRAPGEPAAQAGTPMRYLLI